MYVETRISNEPGLNKLYKEMHRSQLFLKDAYLEK